MTKNGAKFDPIQDIVACLNGAKAVRQTLPSGARIHIDRPLPFLCVYHEKNDAGQAAHDIAAANASYLVSPDLAGDTAMLNSIGQAMINRFGAFLVIEVSEFDQEDRKSTRLNSSHN